MTLGLMAIESMDHTLISSGQKGAYSDSVSVYHVDGKGMDRQSVEVYCSKHVHKAICERTWPARVQ